MTGYPEISRYTDIPRVPRTRNIRQAQGFRLNRRLARVRWRTRMRGLVPWCPLRVGQSVSRERLVRRAVRTDGTEEAAPVRNAG